MTPQPDVVEGAARGVFPKTLVSGNARGTASPPKPPARDEDVEDDDE